MAVQLLYELEVYPSRVPLEGGVFKLPDGDYLQAERGKQSSHYSILWPTDAGVVDAISMALSTFGQDTFTNGGVAEKGSEDEGNAYGDGAVEDIVVYLRKEADLQKLSHVRLTSPEVTFVWGAPAKRIANSNLYKAELGLMATGVSQDKVSKFISDTALSGISGQYPKAMRLLSSAVPVLQLA